MSPSSVASSAEAHATESGTSPSALITGASRGIGRAIALHLAELGYRLTLTARGAEALEVVAQKAAKAGSPQVEVVAADSANREALASVVETHETAYGAMDALILNAGVGTSGPIDATDLQRLDKTLEVNFVSAVLLIRSALPMLRKAAASPCSCGSRILALSSITGAYAEPGLAVYGASKAALLSLIETTNIEEASNGVTATAIAPAFVATDMSAWIADVIDPDSMIPTSDIVHVIDMLLNLSSRSVIGRIVMSRAGTSGYCA